MPAKLERPRVEVTSRKAWRAWLARNHRTSEGIWLVTYKRDSGGPHVPYDDIVREALCFGWIDSLPRKLDAERSMLLLTPRKAKSAWSAANKKRIAELESEGLMTAAGRALVEAAKKSGAWTKLDDVDALVVPDDLQAALARQKSAAANFAAFPRSVKRGILEWIGNAKKPETRAARITETAARAAKNERANQWRQPKK